MEKKQILEALKKVKEQPKKKFNQTFDLIINLKGINLKDPNQKIEYYLVLPKATGVKKTIYGLVDKELMNPARDTLDGFSVKDDFKNLDDKQVKKIAGKYDIFIAQANIMVDIAKRFGKLLGMKGKMPSPKAGQVIPPDANLKDVCHKLQNMARIITKKDLSIKVPVGKEDMKEEDVAENILFIYTYLVQHLPQEKHSIKNFMIKTTMGKPVVIGKND
ncbi:MAG: hypothetical protein PHE43_00420 [Candidatus Nanoarchaeia archaeon]|nr:hypothetical protein [Candidatus Nanoarchaeia archaeon]